MKEKIVIIIGAGPAGLSAGLELTERGQKVIIMEKDTQIGGMSKTISLAGNLYDLGPHRFFSKNRDVLRIWQTMLGKDFLKVRRLTRIYYNNKFFKYPIEIIDTIKKAGFGTSIICGLSYIRYRLFPIKPEKSFSDWTTNHFGQKLFLMFFKSYTEKVWGISTDKLSSQWAAQRIKGLSLWATVKNALFKPKTKAKSLIDEFFYPRFGAGMMYERMADKIIAGGGKIVTNRNVQLLLLKNNRISEVGAIDRDGKEFFYVADHFISTAPLPETIGFLKKHKKDYERIAKNLKFRNFVSVNLLVNKSNLFPDNWIYVHDGTVKVGRIPNFKNFSTHMVVSQKNSNIGCEYFCDPGDKIWKSSDSDLIILARAELAKLGIVKIDEVLDASVSRVENAYPVYAGNYEEAVSECKKIIDSISNLEVAGRGGLFRYNNMDHSVLTGLAAAKKIMGENQDIWGINSDDDYHENDNGNQNR